MKLTACLILILFSTPALHSQTSDQTLYPVNDGSGKTIYIDRSGKEVFTVEGTGARFSEGLARLSVGGKSGYIDRTGNLIIQAQSLGLFNFSQGLARFDTPSKCGKADDKQYFGFIDRTGMAVIQPTLSHPCNYYGDQFDFKPEGLALTQVDNGWGFIDKSGKVVMQFEEARPFSDGVAAVRVNGKWGYVDPAGGLVIKPQFDYASAFSESLAPVKLNGLAGFIDKTGAVAIPFQFTNAMSFSDGMAGVQLGEGWGYIDHSGKVIITPDRNRIFANPFASGRARVSVDREEGYLDKTGQLVIDSNYYMAEDFYDGLAFVIDTNDRSREYIDSDGKVVYKFPIPKGQEPDSRNPYVRINSSEDVKWLEHIAGSPEAAAELRPGSGPGDQAKDLSVAAYARLGQLGTEEAIAAVHRIEERAKKQSIEAPASDAQTNSIPPAWHFSDAELKPLAEAADVDGIRYAIVLDSRVGDLDLFLIRTTNAGAKWSRPKLIPNRINRGAKDATLTAAGKDKLVFSFTQESPPPRALTEGTHDPVQSTPKLVRQTWTLSPSQIEKDSDGDGWTDIEEERLELNPKSADTDGDGIPDGQDVCPNYAPPSSDGTDEEVQIFQKALFAAFGLSGSHRLLHAGEPSRRVQLWGYPGPIIYGPNVEQWGKDHQHGANFVSWRVRKRTTNEVTVEIVDYKGALAASGQDVKLRKIGNEWFVINRQGTWVS